MQGIFFETFLAMLDAIVKILLVALIAGYLVRRGHIKEEYIKGLSEITIKVFITALTFDIILNHFNPWQDTNWWILPLFGLVAPIVAGAFAMLFYLKNLKKNLNKIPLGTLQNVGYLVLPIVQILYPDKFSEMAMFVFMLSIGFSIALWSIGKVLITRDKEHTKITIRDFLNPPLIANILAIIMVFAKVNRYIPDLIMEPVKILGQAAVPSGMFILGATLGSISFEKLPGFADILKLTFIKYGIYPLLTIVFLFASGLKSQALLADFLVIEASAAPAANLIVIVKKYGGDEQQTASLMLIMYLEAIFFMPLWLALWKNLLA